MHVIAALIVIAAAVFGLWSTWHMESGDLRGYEEEDPE